MNRANAAQLALFCGGRLVYVLLRSKVVIQHYGEDEDERGRKRESHGEEDDLNQNGLKLVHGLPLGPVADSRARESFIVYALSGNQSFRSVSGYAIFPLRDNRAKGPFGDGEIPHVGRRRKSGECPIYPAPRGLYTGSSCSI
jgi:hypothetical protein